MNKNIVFPALCIALLLSLFLAFLVLPEAQPGANEVFAEKPVLMEDGVLNGSYFSDFAQYYSQRFGFRQNLITLYARLSAALFRQSESGDVILGEDGWLYYASTLEDFSGVRKLTNRELFSAANNLSLIQDHCRQKGIAFAFLPVPNKSTLYPGHLENLGSPEPENDLTRLLSLLEDMDVPVIDLKSVFSEQEEELYFAHDSHWNEKGAALGADLINAWAGKASSYYAGDFSQKAPHSGDLYEMLYPTAVDTETAPVYGGGLTYTFCPGSGTKSDSITIRTESPKESSLFLYRDSFGNLLYPYLADSNGYCVFSRSTVYTVPEGFDAFVMELVERNLGYLINSMPGVPAPERGIRLTEVTGETAVEVREGSLPGYRLWQGKVTDADDASPVYLLTEHTSYRAFLLEGDVFCALLPEGEEVTGISYCAGGTLTSKSARTSSGSPAEAIFVEKAPEKAPEELLPEGTEPVETAPNEEKEARNARMELAKTFLDRDVKELIAALGEPLSADYASSCLGAGEDGNLYYDGFTVYTYREGSVETVRFVE